MTLKIFGAFAIILACGSMGYSMAHAHRKEERALQALIRAMELMQWHLQERLIPLPELLEITANEIHGVVGQILRTLGSRLDAHAFTSVSTCMENILQQNESLNIRIKENLRHLGQILGRFALSGQLEGLHSVILMCKRDLDAMSYNREARLRGYATLGFCAGVALVILFF